MRRALEKAPIGLQLDSLEPPCQGLSKYVKTLGSTLVILMSN
jgi:hypothetical protein